MTGFLTPAQARETMPCPLARTFSEKVGPNCDAGKCLIWRWLPLDASDDRFVSAIKREIACLAQDHEKAGGKKRQSSSFHKEAVANVMSDPKAYGVPDAPERGWCGLGGRPEQ